MFIIIFRSVSLWLKNFTLKYWHFNWFGIKIKPSIDNTSVCGNIFCNFFFQIFKYAFFNIKYSINYELKYCFIICPEYYFFSFGFVSLLSLLKLIRIGQRQKMPFHFCVFRFLFNFLSLSLSVVIYNDL